MILAKSLARREQRALRLRLGNEGAARIWLRSQSTSRDWRPLHGDPLPAVLCAEALGWARLTTTPSGAMWLQLTPEGVALAASGGVET